MKKEFSVLQEALFEGGKIAKKYAGKVGYELKAKANLVTIADFEVQKRVIKVISAAFPAHAFLAEEAQKGIKTEGRFKWVIDPIDGTTNYAHTFPHSAVSIALADNNKILLGGVYDFFKEEIFTAVKGQGAKLNGKKISASKTKRLEDSLLITGFAYDRSILEKHCLPLFKKLILTAHDIRRSGSAALDLCWAATGRIDGYWEFNLKPWDVAAGKLILEEAGGKVTDFDGKPWAKLQNYGIQTLATNGRIHKEMLRAVREILK